ncbi:probable folate-biopterin transporter 8, chloroplastic [Punica granatum]|nr:probable folate-biopterin transporter 8, chloroplastic [Punica granatum]
MSVLCGFGYWVQGFRCFPWLALNFHMAHNLSLHPSALQLVQNSGNLPMVAKPLYGILSDAFYINGAHRLPYISIGVLLQVLSWGPLALIPSAREALPNLMACVLLSNLGASITEVAMDALVAEYGQRHRANGLQSYAFMASAVGGILGNFLGGYFWPTAASKTMFFVFSILLIFQLAISMAIKEEALGIQAQTSHYDDRQSSSILGIMGSQMSNLRRAIQEETISSSLVWVVSSIAMVPLLSGSIFCYQTQCLHLDPAVLGMSRVVGQLVALSASFLFDRFWKSVTMRKLIGCTQALYAFSLLLDLVLVKQINLRIGIPNEIFVLCFSSLAEAIAQFKLLPFIVLFANLCPRGCEGSLMSFLASALCLSSIVSGFFGVGLASLIGITSGDFSSLAGGILVQFVAAMLPLRWIDRVPASPPIVEKEKKRGRSKRSRRNKRIGRVVLRLLYAYRRERESETLQR